MVIYGYFVDCPDLGSQHSGLTARIMAGASARRHGTRTAKLLLISGHYY